MTDTAIEQEIQAKGLTAPRITPQDIEDNIVDVEFVKHVSKTGQVLRWAVITTRNGYAVVGKPSCAVSSANDNAEIGEKVAVANSRDELWPLMGYELRSLLARRVPSRLNVVVETPVPLDENSRIAPHQKRVIDEKSELDAKLDKLVPFLSSDTCHSLSFDERSRLKRQADVMAEYSTILGERIASFGA